MLPELKPLACLLLALSGHPTYTDECPLSGARRTWRERAVMSANDPKRTSEQNTRVIKIVTERYQTQKCASLVKRKLAQRILVSATAGGVRDVETFERAVFAEPSLAASAPAVSKPLPRKQLEAPTQRKGLLEFQSEEGSALSSLETKRGSIPCLQALRRT
jgi:hypothetical protein